MVDGREDSLVRGLLTGIAAFRWLAWTWMAIVLLLSRDDLERTWLAVVLVGAALLVTAAATLVARLEPERLCTLPALALELSGAGARAARVPLRRGTRGR